MVEDAFAGIASFTLRGNYPNQRSLLRRLDERAGSGAARLVRPQGYMPPVVEYRLAGGEDAVGEVEIREVDIPILAQSDAAKAARHLETLLRLRRGEGGASSEIEAATRAFYQPFKAKFGPVALVENKFTVPSLAQGSYREAQVSHKGSILLRLSALGYPVPDFTILTSEAYLDREASFESNLKDAIANLENLTGQTLGSPEDPVIFAIRTAMPRYVPGIMPTYLNVGVTEFTLPALERALGRLTAVRMYLNNLKNLVYCLDETRWKHLSPKPEHRLTLEEASDLTDRLRKTITAREPRLLTDAFFQTLFYCRESYKIFEDNTDLLLTLSRGRKENPALILQKMICTVRDERSYAGVVFSRHSKLGTGKQLEIGRNLFGEAIMTGKAETEMTGYSDRAEIREAFPAVYHFSPQLADLEKEFETPVCVEFAVEARGSQQFFALLQLNEAGMTGHAAFIAAVDLHKAGVISRKRVTELILPYHVKQMESDAIAPESFEFLGHFCAGTSVLPRAAVTARIYFTADSALDAKGRGERVCFCKNTFKPKDTVVMSEVDAIVSLTSAALHVVTICQSNGVPALLNLEKAGVRFDPQGKLVNAAGDEIAEGEWITISSRRQALFRGKAKFKPARLMRYMRGEVEIADPAEKKTFDKLAYAYKYYYQMIRSMKETQISSLGELSRLVNTDLRGDAEEARKLVRSWFEANEEAYNDGVFASQLGDHLNQSAVFDRLAFEQRVRFFKRALARCRKEKISGYSAGAFMLGRFINNPRLTAFWRVFTPLETAILLNEWILFEKYMHTIYTIGEKKVARARKQILKEGLEPLPVRTNAMRALIPLKLSRPDYDAVERSIPDWADPQVYELVRELRRPYKDHFNYAAEWSLKPLKDFCDKADLPLPAPDEV